MRALVAHRIARFAGLTFCVWSPGPIAAAAAEHPVSDVSVVQVPLEIDLTPLFSAADAGLPSRAGDWPRWRDWHGIEARYLAWRGPLWLAMQGDMLQAQAHVRYSVQARKRLLGALDIEAGCGVDEPPRQALVGLSARFAWGPDWTLRPGFRVMPTRLLDRCEVTVASIDVSPLVGRVFEDRIKDSLADAMRAIRPRLEQTRAEAAGAWRALQTPHELAPGLWLQVQPLGLALAPPRGAGARLQTAVWLAFRASVGGGAPPGVAATPLPPLVPFVPDQPGLRFGIALDLDYPSIAAALSERIAGRQVEIQDRDVRIESVGIGARGQDLVVEASLVGDLIGRIEIMARPGFDTDRQALRLDDLDFVLDAEDSDPSLMVNLFYDRIRALIETQANGLLAERSSGLRDALEDVLSGVLPEELAPDLSGLRLSDLTIEVRDTGLRLKGSAGGSLTFGSGSR